MLPSLQVQVQGQGTVSADNLNSYAAWCPNVSTLRGFIGIGQMLVYLEGTVTPGDGGQGNFYWNSTGSSPDDNGVTTVVPNGSVQGEWTRIPSIVTGVQNLTNAINFASAGNIASAATTPIGAAVGNFINITGTTTITAFDTVQAGSWRVVRFTGILVLTYNATSLILPGAANITTAAGDTAEFVSLGSGNWLCVNYTRASGMALIPPKNTITKINIQNFTGNSTYTPSTGMIYCIAKISGGGGGGGSVGNGVSYGAGGGGSGGYAEVLLTAAQISSSQSITIGTGGTGGAAGSGNNAGNSGNTTTLGSLISCTGGNGGSAGNTQSSGGAGGTVTVSMGTVIISYSGQSGGDGAGLTNFCLGGAGGSIPTGNGGSSTTGSVSTASTAGRNGNGNGSGGSGGANNNTLSGVAGGNGANGIVSITEFISM